MEAKKELNTTTLLIDGDIAAYQITSSNEEETRWDDDIWTLFTDLEVCKREFPIYINYLKEKLEADNVIVVFSDKKNFRKDVYPEYKNNRKDKRKPVGYRPFVDWIKDNFTTLSKANIEADDVLGILSTFAKKDDVLGKRIIVSIDKDFESIPGWLFNPDKDEVPRKISEKDANNRFYLQTLMGDHTDGYPGIKGVGVKTAEKILEGLTTEEDIWERIVAEYVKAGHDEEFALKMARCARILRATDWDFKEGKPILWSPKKKVVKETIKQEEIKKEVKNVSKRKKSKS